MKTCVLLIAVFGVTFVEPHGYLKNPLARTSMHKAPNENHSRPPYYYDDYGIECNSPPNNHGSCARCGNGADMNAGGPYDKGDIMGNYTAGSIITVISELTASHRGYVEFDLCTSNQENDNCFQRLPIVSGSGPVRVDNRMCVAQANGEYTARLQLPSGFRCTKCTLRWNYRTSYPPESDACFNPNTAQTFRNCANIAIR